MLNVPELVAQCIFFGRSPASDTVLFKGLKHDALCARLLRQLEVIASLCGRDNVHPSLTQGPRDQGGDVLLRYKSETDAGLLVFQVKSHDELDAGLSKALKAGLHDSQGHYKDIGRYYIALFGESRSKARRITAMNTEFSNFDIVRVVEPEYLATFLSLDATQIAGVYQRVAGPVTWTYEVASLEEVGQFDDDDELYFVLACMFHYFEERDSSLPESFYLDDERLYERFESQQVADFRGQHTDGLIESWATKDDRLRTEFLPGIEAMYRRLVAEKNWDIDSAFAYMFSFLRKSAKASPRVMEQ